MVLAELVHASCDAHLRSAASALRILTGGVSAQRQLSRKFPLDLFLVRMGSTHTHTGPSFEISEPAVGAKVTMSTQ